MMDCLCEKVCETPNLRDHQIMRKITGILHYWMAGGYLKDPQRSQSPKWLIWNSLITQIWGIRYFFLDKAMPVQENPEIN